jgi:predicted ATPase
MIISTRLKNFKGFQNEITFPVSKINLLTGINGRGKSSFLQSILLIRQSIEEQDSFEKVIFNGSCVNLGTFQDVKNRSTGNDSPIEIFHETTAGSIKLSLTRDEKDDMIGRPDRSLFNDLPLEFRHVHYVAADRVGPQEFYIKSTLPNFINVGTKGEFVANVLMQKKADLVHDNLSIKEKNSSQDLEIQTGEWLSKILDTDNVKVFVSNEGSTRVITLSFGFGQTKFRPANIGFGYTYILPIIVSGLIAKEGEMIIVENPEAHLHPKAQSNLVQFLSTVASCGVQIFIESHSEHILNGLRLCALRKEIDLTHEDISILYFQDDVNHIYTKLNISENGKIDNWIEGFFDQQEIDLAEIFKLQKNSDVV